MKTVNSRLVLYILFGASFAALLGIYIWEYNILTSNQKETTDQSRVLWMSHHLDKFQLAFNDALYYEKPLVIREFPEKIHNYSAACTKAKAQLDTLKGLCGNAYIPCDDIMSLDSLVKLTFNRSDKIVALGLQSRLDSVVILLSSPLNDSLRVKVNEKYDETATHARKDAELFRKRIENESTRRYVLLGLLIAETLLFFGFFLWRISIQLSDKEVKRKEAEKRLQIVNKAIEQSSASVVITNLKGDIEYVNPAFTKLTGYTFEEVIGQNPSVLKSGHTPLIDYEQLWRSITNNKEWQGEFMNKKKNGDFYWEYAIISPISNEAGELTNFVAVKENITERKRLEKEQKHLLDIVENSSAYIFTFDLNMKFLYANRAMKEILEIGNLDIAKYLIGQFQSPKAEAATPDVKESLLLSGKWTGESAYKTLSGKLIPVMQVFILHKDEHGKPVYISATGIDITKQKEAENELIHLNKELRTLSMHLQHVRETEKNKIAKEVHDELGQGLASLKLDISWIKRHLKEDTVVLEKKIDEVILSLSDKLAAFRKIYTSANTTMIEEIGLHASLEYLVDLTRRSGNGQVYYTSNIENDTFDSDISLSIYRIVEFSLTNSLLYADATRVVVNLQKKDNVLILDVQDDGLEIDATLAESKLHYSILEMRERVYALNGKFDINFIKGEGAFMSIEIPMT